MPRAKRPRRDPDGNEIKKTPPRPASTLVPDPREFVPHAGQAPGSTLVDLDALVSAFLPDTGCNVRVTFDRTGTTWYKIGLRTERWPNHYLIVSLPSAVPFSAGVAAVLERLHLVNRGLLKPSPEKWED